MKIIKKIILILVIILIVLLIVILAQKKKTDRFPKAITAETPNELIEIELNEFNGYNYKKIDDKLKVIYIFNDFKEKELYSIENAYSLLNNEYKEKRFKNIDSFKEYINNNLKELKKSDLYAYKIENYEGYTQYLISDQFGRYYVFNETSPMEYTVMLDNYTIDLPSFIDTYNSSNDKNKVSLNIQKIVQAINEKDYQYIYNYLDENFKKNNYPTLDDFTAFVKETLYSKVKLQLNDYTNEGKTNIYNITLNDANNIENPGINLQIVMKLKEDRDFVMSFSLQ